MKLKELLSKYAGQKPTPVFINGMGVGKILKIEEDYIDFETIREEEKKLMKEILHIQISNITTISEGQKDIPKTEQEKNLEDDLGEV